jgi:hypothetical protein
MGTKYSSSWGILKQDTDKEQSSYGQAFWWFIKINKPIQWSLKGFFSFIIIWMVSSGWLWLVILFLTVIIGLMMMIYKEDFLSTR